MFAIYTDGLIRFFSQIHWQGRPVPVVNAGPDRAHAQVHDWLKRNRAGVTPPRHQGEHSIPYPFIAIEDGRYQEDKTLTNPSMYRNLFKSEDDGFGLAMRHPMPVTTNVTVNFYMNNLVQRDFIELQIHTLFPFSGTAWIPVDFRDPKWYKAPNDVLTYAQALGTQQLQLDKGNLQDNSSLEDSGLKGKEIRFTLACVLHGWIPYQAYAVPLVLTTEYEIVDELSEEVLLTVTKEAEEEV